MNINPRKIHHQNTQITSQIFTHYRPHTSFAFCQTSFHEIYRKVLTLLLFPCFFALFSILSSWQVMFSCRGEYCIVHCSRSMQTQSYKWLLQKAKHCKTRPAATNQLQRSWQNSLMMGQWDVVILPHKSSLSNTDDRGSSGILLPETVPSWTVFNNMHRNRPAINFQSPFMVVFHIKWI